MLETDQVDDDYRTYEHLKSSGSLDEMYRQNPAYSAGDDLVLAIPEDTFMRRDSTQVVFYGRQFLDTWCNRLTPAQAAVIALMDGHRALGDISELLRQYCGGDKELNDFKVRRVLAFIEVFSTGCRKLIVRNRQPDVAFKKYDPKDFFIPEEKFEISSELDKPVSILWMPTSVCQTDCAYCYATRSNIDRSQLISDERVKELFEEAAALGVCKVNVDGGDALCRKNITELIAYAASLNVDVDISTKAYVSKELAERLFDAGIKIIQFGFDAPYPGLFDEVVAREGHFFRTIESINNCADAGIKVRTNSILIQRTYRAIHDLVSLLYTLPLVDMKICPAFRSAYRHRQGILLTEEQKQWLRKQLQILQAEHTDGKIKFDCRSDYLALDERQRQEAFNNYPRCGVGTESMIIAPDGRVVMCEQSPHTDDFAVGSVKNRSIIEVWQSDQARDFKRVSREQFTGTVCYDCEDFENCFHRKGGCFILSVKAYGTRFAPHPACPKAPRYDTALQ
jgi:radical SAM protein with 4Fe4S-binding SPASM domain